MIHSRRAVLARLIATGALVGLPACGLTGEQHATVQPLRRMMINGNMVIPFAGDGPLNPEDSAMILSSRITAAKASIGGSSASYEDAHAELDNYDEAIALNPHVYHFVGTVTDVDNAFEAGRIGIIKSFEASTMFEDDLDRISEFAARDVLVMQLGYNERNTLGAGVMSEGGALGLTPLGHDAVAEIQSNGVLLDLSHAHETTSLDAIRIATRPVALTHTGCRSLNDNPRNSTDRVMRSVSATGGVVGIFELSYLTASLDPTPFEAYFAHLEHALNVCGEDHVGIGSDALLHTFDTGPESVKRWNEVTAARKAAGIAAPGEGPMPFVVGLNGPHRMTTTAEELDRRGYHPRTIDKIVGLNFRRTFKDAWGRRV